jgi:AhpD family alkylhydroperoxidase
MDKVDDFNDYREKMNKRILEVGDLQTKRFFSLDNSVYKSGKLDAKTKELLGLVASTVLRCDDCVRYHLIQSKKMNTSYAELIETLNIALIVGGSIVIPHYRKAIEFLDELEEKEKNE